MSAIAFVFFAKIRDVAGFNFYFQLLRFNFLKLLSVGKKLDHCLNCGQKFLNEENFCPVCGQENKSQKISIFAFIEEFISSLFNFETAFFRTIPAFLFSPGKLTIEFNKGKRKKYINPIRLYLIASLFYFFVIAWVIPADILDRLISGSMSKEFFELNTTPEQREDIGSSLDKMNSQELTAEMERLNLVVDSSSKDSTTILDIANRSRVHAAETWRTLRLMAIDTRISDKSFDSAFQKTGITTFGLDSVQKRDFIANSNQFISNSITNLPLMMFFLLPFFAFLLWVLYLRSKIFYIEHLIHGLHLHSFAYFIYGLGILWMSLVGWNFGLAGFLCFSLVTLYAYFSMKKISGQGLFKTIMKFLILGIFYLTILSLALTLELYYSVMTL